MNRLKSCSNCFEMKPLSEFYRKLRGYQSRCKACNPEVVRAYRYRLLERKFGCQIKRRQKESA